MKTGFRKLLHLTLLCLCTIASSAVGAQPLGNEWIDYSKNYYKIRIGAEGLYKIDYATLTNAGFPTNIQGDQLIMIQSGQEIPIYISNNGNLNQNDFILFPATINNGSFDATLYEGVANQTNEHMSLFSDTATYFLTYDGNSNHLRYLEQPNIIPPAPGAALSWVWATSAHNFKNIFVNGTQLGTANDFYFSSAFHRGEGFINRWSNYITDPVWVAIKAENLFAAAGVQASVRSAILSKSLSNNHSVKVKLNGQQIADLTYGSCDVAKVSAIVSSSQLVDSNVMEFQHYNIGSGTFDQFGAAYYLLNYPRNTSLNQKKYFSFQLPPSSSNRYLVFQNFQHTGQQPYLLSKTGKKMFRGDLSNGDVRFYLPPSLIQDTLYLASTSGTQQVQQIKRIQFTNFSSPAQQGDYIIVTHPSLQQVTNGHNYIDDYKTYRSSAIGGNYKVVIANVEELYDQFAYGVRYHPLGIRNFFQFAVQSWTTRPLYANLIGKGLLYQYQRAYDSAGTLQFPIVPGYGDPGSDNLLGVWGNSRKLNLMIGRISAWEPQEVGNYLEKMMAYEQAIKPSANSTYETELWKKKILHIAGSNDKILQDAVLLPNLNNAKPIIEAPYLGGMVTTIAKNSTTNVTQISNAGVDSMINNGLAMITYHGHGSANGFDYNLNAPESYNSKPKFPLFLAMACDVARIYNFNNNKTLSEKFQDAPNGGTINYIASSALTFTSFHGNYMKFLYHSISEKNYGGTIGEHVKSAFDSFAVLYPPSATSLTDDFYFGHVTSHILQGDPATRLLHTPQPDYHVHAQAISTLPANINTALDSFQLKIVSYNLGKAIRDSVRLKVAVSNASSNYSIERFTIISQLHNVDTQQISLPIDKVKSIGLNKVRVTIDPDNLTAEANENNNTAAIDLFIYSDNLVPVYPYNFSIVGDQNIILKASTLNPFKGPGRYKIQIDTTELFNSVQMRESTLTSGGGVITWKPNLTYLDSTVYYWRCALDSVVNGNYVWSNSTFIFLPNIPTGWNQSHYFQYIKNGLQDLTYEEDRIFKYAQRNVEMRIRNAINGLPAPLPAYDGSNINVNIDGNEYSRFGCSPFTGTLQIMVLDSNNLLPEPNSAGGKYGAYPICAGSNRNWYSFEFAMNTIAGRDSARKLIDNISDGKFILIRNNVYYPQYVPSFAQDWKADENINGPGISLYHSLKNVGFADIDSFNRLRTFYGIVKKGFTQSFTPQMMFTKGIADSIDITLSIPAYGKAGLMKSVVLGPTTEWKQLFWHAQNLDTFQNTDSSVVEIYGITNNNTSTLLGRNYSGDTALSWVDAQAYPRLQLLWYGQDSKVRSSTQLKYWRVYYQPVPEVALNAAQLLSFKDSVFTGEHQQLAIAIKNLTPLPMDSLLVRYRVINQNNVSNDLKSIRYRPLPGDDSLHASLSFDPRNYPGNNLLFIEVNPDNDQPEQYHPNNLGYLPFKVIADNTQPLLDVTFDGVHILDGDIVSAKPLIKILLKDDNKFLQLDDTALVKLYLRKPNQDFSQRNSIPLDGVIAKFYPSESSSKKNEAFIEFKPTLPDDGVYELYVEGKDKVGNTAGGSGSEYRITFEVINKATITNLLNYPNPFSTSTAFLFELTGSEIPHQFKIQIMTVTGKVVKEITRQELGPLHVGRNITEYKWDGKDQYGQILGNGVYLYRVVTTLNGEKIEHRQAKNGGEAVDKFWRKGWGKMYIMR